MACSLSQFSPRWTPFGPALCVLFREMSVLETTKRCKERQRPSLGVCLSEVSVKKELTVILLVVIVICSSRTHPFFYLSRTAHVCSLETYLISILYEILSFRCVHLNDSYH